MNFCSRCGKNFRSTFAFDKHRTGKYTQGQFDQPERRCRTTEEMLERGMAQNGSGLWVSEPNTAQYTQEIEV